ELERARPALTGARVLLCQLEIPLPVVISAAELASRAGVEVVLDPAPARKLPSELLSRLALIRLNSHEAQVVTGHAATDLGGARDAASWLLEQGVRAVVVQAGGEGNLLLTSGGELILP